MVSRRDQPGQASLFGDEPPGETPRPPRTGRCATPPPIDPAPLSPHLTALAQRLPRDLYLGTSSWSFPGWAGLVYARDAPTSDLARRGLPANHATPLFPNSPLRRTVGLDRTFYAPISEGRYADYAAAVPDGFRFLVKAYSAITRPTPPPGPEDDRGINPRFLDPAYAADTVIEPAHRGLRHKLGPILFQFSPMRLRGDKARGAFIDRLARFLDGLPRGPLYAVEIRDRALLTPAYARAIAATPRGVCHAFNIHPTMPPPQVQAALIPPDSGPALVARWILHEGQTYEGATPRYAPFNRIVDDDPATRAIIADLCAKALAAGRPAWVIANNKAEGSAPLTIAHLAQAIDARHPRHHAEDEPAR